MSYLFPFVYLYLHSMTTIHVDGREVLIQKNPSSTTWRISTPVIQGRGEFPKETHECLKLVQQLKWDSSGAIEVDAVLGTIHWTQEMDPSDFGKEFPKFLRDAQEWEEVLSEELNFSDPADQLAL